MKQQLHSLKKLHNMQHAPSYLNLYSLDNLHMVLMGALDCAALPHPLRCLQPPPHCGQACQRARPAPPTARPPSLAAGRPRPPDAALPQTRCACQRGA